MNYRYEIDEANAIRVYADDADVPFLFQPDYPNGTPWADRADAEAWAQLYIASLTDENALLAPAGPGIAGEPKPPSPQAKAEAKASAIAKLTALGLSDAEISALVG